MALIEEFEKSGSFLFRYRSYFPLTLIFVIIATLYSDPEGVVDFTNVWWISLSILISALGFIIRVITIGTVPKGTSGKNTKKQIAQKLNHTGIYSVVRHPLYVGNFLMWMGPIVYSGSLWLMIITVLLYALYYERIMFTEERFLRDKYGNDYLKWASKTPAFIPSLLKWTKSDLDFSFKNALKRETHSFTNTIFTFSAINIIKNYLLYQEFKFDFVWQVLVAFSIVMFLIVLIIRKSTNLLDVKGR